MQAICQNQKIYFKKSCNELWSWMDEIWMKSHLVGDNICNIVIHDAQNLLQGRHIMLHKPFHNHFVPPFHMALSDNQNLP